MQHKQLAYFFLKFTFGFNFFMHGIVRVFGDYQGFVDKITSTFSKTILPEILVQGYAYSLPVVELLLGLALMIGWFNRQALILSFIVLNSLIFGSSLIQNWSNVGTQMVYVLFLFLLVFFKEFEKSNFYSKS